MKRENLFDDVGRRRQSLDAIFPLFPPYQPGGGGGREVKKEKNIASLYSWGWEISKYGHKTSLIAIG